MEKHQPGRALGEKLPKNHQCKGPEAGKRLASQQDRCGCMKQGWVEAGVGGAAGRVLQATGRSWILLEGTGERMWQSGDSRVPLAE